MSQTIIFYRERDEPYGCFSNFSKHGFELGGKFWPTVEHYFQAMKFVGTPHEDDARTAKSSMDVKHIGNDRSRPLRPDWEGVKDDVMREAVRAKFEQNDDIRETLIGTGDAHLIEDAPNDYYWGRGEKHTGKNHAGHHLDGDTRGVACSGEADLMNRIDPQKFAAVVLVFAFAALGWLWYAWQHSHQSEPDFVVTPVALDSRPDDLKNLLDIRTFALDVDCNRPITGISFQVQVRRKGKPSGTLGGGGEVFVGGPGVPFHHRLTVTFLPLIPDFSKSRQIKTVMNCGPGGFPSINPNPFPGDAFSNGSAPLRQQDGSYLLMGAQNASQGGSWPPVSTGDGEIVLVIKPEYAKHSSKRGLT